MNINYEALQFFILKKVIKRKDAKAVLDECERLNMSAEQYLVAKDIGGVDLHILEHTLIPNLTDSH